MSNQKEPAPPTGTVYAMQYAHMFRRLWAASIDVGLLLSLVVFLRWAGRGFFFSGGGSAPQDIMILLGYLILFTGLRGQTPGKMVAGIIVVDREGRVPGVAVAIPREVVGRLVATIAMGLGLAWISFDPKRQGWHDKIAGTYVVMKPKPERPDRRRNRKADGPRPADERRVRSRPWRARRRR